LEDHTKRAKELFEQYNGNFFQMHREDAYEEYRKYDISKRTEAEWFAELIQKHVAQLSIRDWQAVTLLEAVSKHYQDNAILGGVVSFASRNVMSADSIVKLMYAEGIIRLIQSSREKISKDVLHDACRVAVRLLEATISEQLTLDPGHALSQHDMKDKKSLNQRAKKRIDEIVSLLS
jgi:hypothetical protein